MDFELTRSQSQILSPRMIQSIEILQMSAPELMEHLETALQENPVLEIEEYRDSPDKAEDLLRRLEWLEADDPQNRAYHIQDSQLDADPLRNFGAADFDGETLFRHLCSQLQDIPLDRRTAACARFLIASLDESGWLEEDIPALAREMDVPEEAMAQALSVVQSLDPAGVAARTLSECLCLQLRRRVPVDRLALRIAADYLEAAAKKRYRMISCALGVPRSEVRLACDVIRSLNPRPGAAFARREDPMYITPDIFVVESAGRFELLTNDRFFPVLSISPYYVRLLQDSEDEQVRDYLSDKVRQAKWVIRAVGQRQNTLMSCARCIVELQDEFFRLGPGHLKPMSLADVAGRAGVHESTVSRAVSGKYLQCSKGTFPLNGFFSRRLGDARGDGAASADAARALLKQLIAEEDKRLPLSDQKLCERMGQEGCVLARRTAAKYREELGIPGAFERKEQGKRGENYGDGESTAATSQFSTLPPGREGNP